MDMIESVSGKVNKDMSLLRIYDDGSSEHFIEHRRYQSIVEALQNTGIVFERWVADQQLPTAATQDDVLHAYREPVRRLMERCGFVTADVISVNPATPNHPEIRNKFLNEHTHSEDEARFFVDGSGIFYIHIAGKIYAVLCERGDFLSVPAGTPHWFDMGPSPFLKVIRTFTTSEGWVANFTGSDIASRFPRFEGIVNCESGIVN